MKLLLTSAGVRNPSIKNALVDLLGKPIADSSALCIPTAMYGHPHVGPGEGVWRFISGHSDNPMCELGWKSLGVLELTALPSIGQEHWVPLVRDTDVLLVSGGDALYLCHWLHESGLADVLPSLSETVWVGLSAGSMVMTPRIGEDFVGWKPPRGDDTTLGIVDFSIFPHLAPEGMPGNSMAEAEQWVAGIAGAAYAIDDETAIRVVDGTVDVISEGQWKLFPPDTTRFPRPARGPVASVRQIQVTFDCAEPERVARFWCEVLGYVVPPPPDGCSTWDDYERALPPEQQGSAFACIDPSGVGPRLFFQRVREGKVVKNRLHLDVRVGTGLVGAERLAALEAECARLVALGAVRVRLLPADGIDESTLVMQDIEGNEFCLD